MDKEKIKEQIKRTMAYYKHTPPSILRKKAEEIGRFLKVTWSRQITSVYGVGYPFYTDDEYVPIFLLKRFEDMVKRVDHAEPEELAKIFRTARVDLDILFIYRTPTCSFKFLEEKEYDDLTDMEQTVVQRECLDVDGICKLLKLKFGIKMAPVDRFSLSSSIWLDLVPVSDRSWRYTLARLENTFSSKLKIDTLFSLTPIYACTGDELVRREFIKSVVSAYGLEEIRKNFPSPYRELLSDQKVYSLWLQRILSVVRVIDSKRSSTKNLN